MRSARIETREQTARVRDVEQLIDFYGVDADTRVRMLDLAAAAHERGYWHAIRKDVPHDFHGVLDIEAALVATRQFETMLVPGLLQTAEYTRALINGVSPGLGPDVVGRRVMARMARQQVLTRDNPLQYHVIMDEAILERPVGSAMVMRNQLRRLVDDAAGDHITIQVLPKAAGASPALSGPFAILTLSEPIPDFGYAETGGGPAVYIEDRADVRTCTLRWGILTGRALSHADSVALIEQAMKGYQ